jgi:hypothetical protein
MISKAFALCFTLNIAFGKLVVYSPQDLVGKFEESKGVINANYANFGHIPYG